MFHGRYQSSNEKNSISKLKIFISAGLFIIMPAFTVQAQEVNDSEVATQAALNTHDEVANEFAQLQFKEKTQQALNALVESGVHALRDNGYAADADKFESQWAAQFEDFLSNISGLNLGDHDPLNQWLADFYDSLKDRLGERILKMLHLDDLYTLNYALPVVFQPRGDARNNDQWDRLEYSRHFIPFAGIVTYWASYIGCYLATREHPGFRKFCGEVANILRNGMRRSVAPRLSDAIYDSVVFGDASADFNIDLVTLRQGYELQISRLPQVQIPR